jgi:DNA-directed RNA polymerase sigma subunit (sigma70/sigma32)
MADNQQPPEWWMQLSAEERAAFHRVMDEDWQPSGTAEEETARAFLKSRQRIGEIEERALGKLRGNGDDKK